MESGHRLSRIKIKTLGQFELAVSKSSVTSSSSVREQ